MIHQPLPKTVAKAVLAVANRPLATRRLHKLISESPAPYRVQIGAGRVKQPGWLLTDIAWNAPAYLDATRPWPFPAGSVSYVYADNVIEHVSMAGGRALLRNAFTAMSSGAVIRMATPDIWRIARIYLANDDLTTRCMDQNRSTGYEVHHPVDLLRNTFTEAGHHLGYLYDLDSLSAELKAAGFTAISRRASGESPDPVLQELELRASDVEDARALIVEAIKP